MLEPSNNSILPEIPSKRYFTIGEVSELCDVKPHVLRYWEQEFTQLRPVKRRGNRRYYQRSDVLVIRQIRSLLYDQGYTIGGARLQLVDVMSESVSAATSTASNVIELRGLPGLEADSMLKVVLDDMIAELQQVVLLLS